MFTYSNKNILEITEIFLCSINKRLIYQILYYIYQLKWTTNIFILK